MYRARTAREALRSSPCASLHHNHNDGHFRPEEAPPARHVRQPPCRCRWAFNPHADHHPAPLPPPARLIAQATCGGGADDDDDEAAPAAAASAPCAPFLLLFFFLPPKILRFVCARSCATSFAPTRPNTTQSGGCAFLAAIAAAGATRPLGGLIRVRGRSLRAAHGSRRVAPRLNRRPPRNGRTAQCPHAALSCTTRWDTTRHRGLEIQLWTNPPQRKSSSNSPRGISKRARKDDKMIVRLLCSFATGTHGSAAPSE